MEDFYTCRSQSSNDLRLRHFISNMSASTVTSDPVIAKSIYKVAQFVPYTTISMLVVLVGIGVAGSETYRTKIQNDYSSLMSYLTLHSSTVLIVAGVVIGLIGAIAIGFYVNKVMKDRAAGTERAQKLTHIQRSQLMRLYRSTGGDHWRDRTRWGSAESIDRWKGIHINHKTGQVCKIILPENNLVGTFFNFSRSIIIKIRNNRRLWIIHIFIVLVYLCSCMSFVMICVH